MEVGTVDTKRLLCRIGRHKYQVEKNEDGKPFRICARCRRVEERWMDRSGQPPLASGGSGS